LPRKRSIYSKAREDFFAKVDFLGVQSEGISPENRIRLVQDILKIWTVRTHQLGRPSKVKGNDNNAA
jgi:hypothetical protein